MAKDLYSDKELEERMYSKNPKPKIEINTRKKNLKSLRTILRNKNFQYVKELLDKININNKISFEGSFVHPIPNTDAFNELKWKNNRHCRSFNGQPFRYLNALFSNDDSVVRIDLIAKRLFRPNDVQYKTFENKGVEVLKIDKIQQFDNIYSGVYLSYPIMPQEGGIITMVACNPTLRLETVSVDEYTSNYLNKYKKENSSLTLFYPRNGPGEDYRGIIIPLHKTDCRIPTRRNMELMEELYGDDFTNKDPVQIEYAAEMLQTAYAHAFEFSYTTKLNLEFKKSKVYYYDSFFSLKSLEKGITDWMERWKQ